MKASITISMMCLLFSSIVVANDVTITQATINRDSSGTYTFSVTLLHQDNGWEHYADKWQVLDSNKNVIAERVLLHPHDDEQPFERSTSGVVIPEGETVLSIRAHDLVHGWNAQELEINLTEMNSQGQLTVTAD